MRPQADNEQAASNIRIGGMITLIYIIIKKIYHSDDVFVKWMAYVQSPRRGH
jgi:hypothetical protein